MNKNILVVVVVVALVFVAFYFAGLGGSVDPTENGDPAVENGLNGSEDPNGLPANDAQEISGEFIECLADAGLMIYGSRTCPFCVDLVESLGGHEVAAPIYVECAEEGDKCTENMKTGYVPEIQFNGELHEGGRSPKDLAELTSCQI